MEVIYDHLMHCKYGTTQHPAIFDVSMRHGAEYPACMEHVGNALMDAYEHDGDHGRVTVYKIGEASETMKWVVS